MKHNRRSDSEKSDETSCSQETTSRNLSDSDCVAFTDNNNMSVAYKNRNLEAFDLKGFDKKDEGILPRQRQTNMQVWNDTWLR